MPRANSRRRSTPVEAVPEPAAAAQDPATAAPDLAAYASMRWPQLIDAMWDAEEAERKGASVTPPAEARAADAGDPAPDSAVRLVETARATAASADANHEINREIQAGDRPVVPFDETVPPLYVDMSGQAPSERLRAARARLRNLPIGRAAGFV